MSGPNTPAPPRKSFPLRLDPALYGALERVAAADFRSVNAEIEVLLREALARRGIHPGSSEPVRRGRPPRETEGT
ncbi:toxin-antitoxin system HicB family antitoxin [Novosphingobium flavum]|uniref:Toxin-antitoxin system HicB family antitoxin n=1 Tax=Novosphingobium aerophilum TaxID=2839843 RepID=A0A7X1F9B6_9SPHN|nr:toxin-antitoxin system HicB family antitoxin [Novosphingobium aerophilum]MBC2652741.1 toxin-antitoxin system HicB family antitoxin [Novosphingobium aerophilum]MBC2662893.1 toxin-antitoxin system HicB family antitoxin [Novosphingobium aerophilum]